MNIKETAVWLKNHDNYLVLTHRRPDGDAHGSAAALCEGLRRLGKKAYILKNPETTDKYVKYVEQYWAEEGYIPEKVLTVDMASEGLFCKGAEGYFGKVDLAIDHHPSNSGYAKELCLNGERASCGEIIYELLCEMGVEIDPELAAPMYVALSTDTGCFAFANTTANTFKVAGELTGTGLVFREINRELFRTKSKKRFVLEGMIMSGIEFYYGGKVSIITITKEMMDKTGCTENDMDDIAAMPGSIEGVICGITMRELTGTTDCKVSVRTSPAVDANALCAVLGGGGHAMASGASPAGMTLAEMKEKLLCALDKVFENEDR